MKRLVILILLFVNISFAQTADDVRRIMNNKNSLYEVLNVSPSASDAEIRSSYRKLMKSFHPDRYLNEPQKLRVATEVMKKLNTTRDTLLDPTSRKRYDVTVKATAQRTQTRAEPAAEAKPQAKPEAKTQGKANEGPWKKWQPEDFAKSAEEAKAKAEAEAKAKADMDARAKAQTNAEGKTSAENKAETRTSEVRSTEKPVENSKPAVVEKEKPVDFRARQATKMYQENQCGTGFFKSFVDIML